MKGDPKVIDYLNRGLRSELTAVSQYWLHYRMLEDWGFKKLAEMERKEAIEEMHHADKFVERILFLEGLPNLQTLDPLRIGQNIKEVLECDLAAEYEARALYKDGRDVAEAAGDYPSKTLFEELMADEEGHIDHIETELELIGQIGIENYGLLQAKAGDEA